jgi:hypothetical protein
MAGRESSREVYPRHDAIDRRTALNNLDQARGAYFLQAAGEHAAATELAERALRSPFGFKSHYKLAASVLLKADRAAAVSQLVHLAEQNPKSA